MADNNTCNSAKRTRAVFEGSTSQCSVSDPSATTTSHLPTNSNEPVPFDSSTSPPAHTNSAAVENTADLSTPKARIISVPATTPCAPRNRFQPEHSSIKILNIMDKRLDKQSAELNDTITKLFAEFKLTFKKEFEDAKTSLLGEINTRFDELKAEVLMDFTQQITEVKNRVASLELKASELDKLKEEVSALNLNAGAKEVHQLKKQVDSLSETVRIHENSVVASDLRITGIPIEPNFNLIDFYTNLCSAINVNPPPVKSMFRVKHFKSYKNVPDPPIVIRLHSPFDKNFLLKSTKDFKRSNNTQMCLRHVGLDSDELFYVNENLTPHNYGIFKTALGLKKKKIITNAYTIRGIVYIRKLNSEEHTKIDTIEQLKSFFPDL